MLSPQKKQPPPVAPKPVRRISNEGTSSPISPPSVQPQVSQNSGKSQEEQLEELTSRLLFSMNQASTEPDFVGLCSRCDGVIKGSHDACIALDRYYHGACFTCQVCSRSLSGHSFYAVEEKILCEGCYVNTLEKCFKCKLPITEKILRATGKPYHPECFTCTHCKKYLDGVPFTVDAHNQIHCIDDFHMKYAPRCSGCRQAILPQADGVETVRVVALDRNFHISCYKCEDCGIIMSTDNPNNGCFPIAGRLLCKKCNGMKLKSSRSSSGRESPLAVSDM